MFGTHDFLLFVAAGLLLNITPGPDMLYVVGRSTAQGVKAGVAAALGIGAGCLVHISAAALGVSAVIAASATAFTVLKLFGAAYLLYVGLSLLFSRTAAQTSAAALPPIANSTIFVQGFLTNALNPKVALFFLAFVPQFISTSSTHKTLAFFLLGFVFNFNGTLWNLLVAWMTAKAGVRWRHSRSVAWLNRCIGSFFIFLGVRLALAKTS
jgi:threonine/homoserine/homoserine lactone efflux protein